MKTKDAIQEFGSQAALARALGISRAAVAKWGDDVPRLREYEILDLRRERDDRREYEKTL